MLQLRAYRGLPAAAPPSSSNTTPSLPVRTQPTTIGDPMVSLNHPGLENVLVDRFSLLSLAGKAYKDLADPFSSMSGPDGGDAFRYGDPSNFEGFNFFGEYSRTATPSSRAPS